MKVAILGAGNVGKNLYKLLKENSYNAYLCGREQTAEVFSFENGLQGADIVILALPYTAFAEVLPKLREKLANKIVIDCSNPLQADWSPLMLGENNSAAEEVARLLPNSYIIKAFNTIFADVMHKEIQDQNEEKITAFIAGDDSSAKKEVILLAEKIGFSPVDVGGLKIARYLETMAHLNIQIAVNQGGGTNFAFIYKNLAL